MLRIYAIMAVAVLIAAVGGVWLSTLYLRPDEAFAECGASQVAGGASQIGGPFELVNADRQTVTDKDVITAPTLIYFGYTFCPDVCPFDMSRNADAVDLLEVLEWLTSPFVYRGDAGFRAEALALAHQVVQPAAIAMHYLHLGERQRATAFANESEVRLKKLFYVLRPALALRWMRLHPDRAIVPMAFRTLVAESDVSADSTAIIDDLLARKAETREMGTGGCRARSVP